MEQTIEILKYTVPAIVVFATAFFMLRMFFDNEQRKRRQEIRMNNQKMITPLRLQAYERLSLFLERISPESMIMRSQLPGMTSAQLQQKLLMTIRTEFEHNLSQQIYIGGSTWEIIKNAKENTVKLINSAANSISSDAQAMELSKVILEQIMQLDASPSKMALDFLKQEVAQLF